ncbi:MAG: CoA transferase [Deltaproteobacteria bacterium]|nr:CoA transferase [Deltaproteobacteria bacterium]
MLNPGGRRLLEGLTVVELGDRVAAPYCGRLFAESGARVIKVEAPGGDVARHWGPFAGDRPDPERGGLFHFLNAEKASIVLDLERPADRDRFRTLVASADLLIESRPPGELARLGLDFPTLAADSPQLVLLSLSPFGQTGPYRDWKGYDHNDYHLSGSGHRYCGRPDQMPLEQGTFLADFYGAIAGAAWALGAIYGRAVAGGGQWLDLSTAELLATTMVGGWNVPGFRRHGYVNKRTGIGLSGAPASILKCTDGHAWVFALEPGQWKGLAKVMGDPEWMGLEIFDDVWKRGAERDVVYPLIEEWTKQHSKWEVMELCQAAGSPSTAVMTVAEFAKHPHIVGRGFIGQTGGQDGEAPMPDLGAPFRPSKGRVGLARRAPHLGEHTQAALAEAERVQVVREPARRGAVALGAASSAGATGVSAGTAAGASGRLPLEGVRVANFGWVWAGPMVGQVLGFLGADVIKVESRARIDIIRHVPPFEDPKPHPERSLTQHNMWAGNGSVSLDLAKPEGRELAHALVRQCDIALENFGPGVAERFELRYADLCKVRPDLVMLSMPAAGHSGPLKNVRTYGNALASLTGLDSLTGYGPGDVIPFEQPMADAHNGVLGAYALLAALYQRRATGEGQLIELSQQEGLSHLIAPAFMDYMLNGRVGGPLGNRHPLAQAAPHGVFPCDGDDQWIAIVVEDDAEWRALAAAIDADWARADAFATRAGRIAELDALHARLADWTRPQVMRPLCEKLQARGVAATPVLDVPGLANDPHFAARGTFVELENPQGFRETLYAPYVKMSRSATRARPGPMIGQDNDRILKGLLGLSESRYAELVEKQVIY